MKAYLMCAFAAFGGIFFGYDTGWMGGIMGMKLVTPFKKASCLDFNVNPN
jgi:hypothetical protein